MNIIILYRTPYHKINYHQAIDHLQNNVIYITVDQGRKYIPTWLQCRVLLRPGGEDLVAETIALLRKYEVQPDRIISINEKEMYAAALLREYYRLPGSSSQMILDVRDKLRMKQVMVRAGINTPPFMCLTDFLKQKHVPWLGKLILKPIDGVSSYHVSIYQNAHELMDTLTTRNGDKIFSSQYQTTIDPRNYEVEMFISETIVHFDGVVYNGHVQCLVSSRYIGNCLNYTQGEPMGSYQTETSGSAARWVQRVIHALGIYKGVFHLEAFSQDEDFIFLEIANRSGGAGIVEMFQLKTGIHLPSYELLCGMEESLVVPVAKIDKHYFGNFLFPGHQLPFEHWRICGHEEFLGDRRMYSYNQQSEGTPLIRHVSYYGEELPFEGIIKCRTPDEACAFIQQMFSRIRIDNASSQ